MNARYTDREKQGLFNEYLVLLCQEGDTDALQQLISYWHRRLYGYALSQLQNSDAAKDATQESLVSISKSIHRLKDPASFPKWAYQIVIRRCADWQRKEIRWRARHATNSASVIEQAASGAIESETETDDLQKAIGLLEPDLSNVVRLHYFESFSLKEIGELLKLPAGTIKSRLYYARKKLKQILESKNDE
jgi:RNA polymerase sigma-70 factor (ECF subfamily)